MDTPGDLGFSTADALRFGWKKTKDNLQPLLWIGGAGAFLALLQAALNGARPGLGSLLFMAVQVLQLGVTLAWIRVALWAYDGEQVQVPRPEVLWPTLPAFLLAAVLYGLLVTVGLALLVVPGLLWAVTYGFFGFALLDRGLGPIAALRESARMTRGRRLRLLGFGLVLAGVNLLGALALGVGLFLSVPTTFIAAGWAYRHLASRAASVVAPPQAPRTPFVAPHQPSTSH